MTKQIGPVRAAILTWMGIPPEITDLNINQVIELITPANTSSGKYVTVDSSLQLSTVWACVRLLSETISTLPLRVYQTNADGSRTLAKSHPLYNLLCRKPNAEYTPSRFMLMVVASVCLRGNAFVELKYIGKRLVALDPLLPQRVRIERKSNGSLEYIVTDNNGKERRIPENRMMHIRGFGIDGLVGLSAIAKGREAIGSATAADQSAGKFFKKGMQPSGFLSTDVKLNDEQRKKIGKSVNKYALSENAGRIMVLEAGMKYQNITMNPEAAQLLETRSFNVEEICRLFRVPPWMVGHLDKTSSWASSVEAQNLHFLTNTLRPLLVNIEQEIRRCLVDPADPQADDLAIEFAVEGLLRADSQGRANYYNSALDHGWMNRNEVRRLENQAPIPGGDIYTVQSALIRLDQVGQNYGQTNEQTPTTT